MPAINNNNNNNDSSNSYYWTCLQEDPKFLLRCALTHNWEAILEFCDILTTIFTSPTDLRWVYAARQQLTAVDEWGNNLLMAAAFFRADPIVVNRLCQVAAVAAWPRSSPMLVWQTQRARDGSTALQVACGTGASLAVVRACFLHVSHHDDNNNDKNNASSPSSYFTLLQHTDHQGGTPLTELVLQYTLERKASSSSSPRNKAPCLEEMPWCPTPSSSSLSSCGGGGNTAKNETSLPRTFCDKLSLLLQAAWQHDHNDHMLLPSLLHQAAHVCYACPPLLWDVIQHQWQSSSRDVLYQTDHVGRSPLHVALLALDKHREYFFSLAVRARRSLRQRQAYAVLALLQKCHTTTNTNNNNNNKNKNNHTTTSAAHVPLPATGQLPLTIAIAAGLSWHHNDHDHHHGSAGVVQHLWHCGARESHDPVSGLPMFALAAVNHEIGHNDNAKDETAVVVSTIFELLRREPQALTR